MALYILSIKFCSEIPATTSPKFLTNVRISREETSDTTSGLKLAFTLASSLQNIYCTSQLAKLKKN